MDLGERIKTIRKARGLNQGQLAELAGIDHGGLCRLEQGGRDALSSTIRAIADALEVPLDELVPRPSDRDEASHVTPGDVT